MPIRTEFLTIRGRLAAADFPAWIAHRADRLGLRGRILVVREDRIDLVVAGPVDLIDAMEVGCSLGPTSVQVETVDRLPGDYPLDGASFAYISDDK